MNTSDYKETETGTGAQTAPAVPAKKGSTLRAALVVFIGLTAVCGVLYPAAVTLVSQTLFPHESNGSIISVHSESGTERTYGSAVIGQQFSDPIHLIGRVNPGAPSNRSPVSDEYRALVELRRDAFASGGFSFTGDIPAELVTVSGSGLDPHISPETAEYQVASIVRARNEAGWKLAEAADGSLVPISPEERRTRESAHGDAGSADKALSDFTQAYVRAVISAHTEGRFLGVFGEPRVNVLLVNATLDGLR